MITTVTLNPMVDKTVRVDSLKRGAIHRGTRMSMVAGGKGINVSRQLARLGIETVATGFLGGETGSIVQKLLGEDGIDHDFVMTDVLTREGVTYLEADGTATAVFEPSGPVMKPAIDTLNAKLKGLAKSSSWIVCSGSSTGTETDEVFYNAVAVARKAGAKSVLDSYGASLKHGLNAVPTLIKPNMQEYGATFGTTLQDRRAILNALDVWVTAGVKYVVLTDGANPSYAASEKGHWKILSPEVKRVNPVGSGDAMVAGLVFGFEKGWDFEHCLSFGAAAGAANARKWEVANSSLEEIESLQDMVVVQKLA